LRLGFAQGLFEELAEQRDDQAVVESKAGLEDVDEVLGVAGFLLADGTCRTSSVQRVSPASFCEPSKAIG